MIIICLSILLSSGAFSLDDYLTERLNNNHYSKDQLTYALSLKLDAAYAIKLTEFKLGTVPWIFYAKLIANSDGQTSKKIADYYYQQGDVKNSIIWYQQAVKLLDSSAVMPLAKLYFSQNKLGLAQKVLESAKNQSSIHMYFAVELAIAQGDLSYIATHLDKLSSSEVGNTLLAKINQYEVLSEITINAKLTKGNYLSNQLQSQVSLAEKNCPTSMQLLASTLADLDKLSQFKKQFKQHPLNKYLCLSEPKYIPINKFHCYHTVNSAISCNEGTWQTFTQNLSTRYIGLLYPYGGANVHLGIMYVDREDTFDIFSHEITHLLGFVDEYPLAKKHPKCDQVQTAMFAQNIAVLQKRYYGNKKEVRNNILKSIPWRKKIKVLTPILTSQLTPNKESLDNIIEENSWLLGTPKKYRGEYGVFNADTCNTADFRSYKPLDKITQLQYYQVEFPNKYLDLLVNNWQEYLMPSFHYNIAMSLLVKGDIAQGRTWLLKSASMETNKTREMKILKAQF